MTRTHPHNCWYALAASGEVGREPLGRRALGRGVVLFRTGDGRAVALEDRCVHRPYPLSRGRLDGDTIVSGYSGFAYDADGVCVRVPTQDEIPVGARVAAFPVHDDGAFVWAWLGDPALAALRPPAALPWLGDPGWTTLGDEWETAADLALLHENFADITHVAVVDPFIAPPVLRSSPPPLEVEGHRDHGVVQPHLRGRAGGRLARRTGRTGRRLRTRAARAWRVRLARRLGRLLGRRREHG